MSGLDDQALRTLTEASARLLLGEGLCLVTAESCTGGWIAKLATDIAGSSEWFERGFVAYSNDAKSAMLGVDTADIATHGAVSEVMATAMARGALASSLADVAVAVTGIAGPGGGSAQKPVGLVWLAWARRGGPVVAERHLFAGSRDHIRRQAVAAALQGIERVLH